LTEDCSIYVMDSQDDLEWYHRTYFPQARSPEAVPSHAVRISITFRWLAKRMTFLGENYDCNDGNRVYAQAVHPRPIIMSWKSAVKRKAYMDFMKMK